MTSQVTGSILVGLAVSAVLFLPLVVWQYRRYGRFDALRMLWTTAGFIYAAAIVAFTVFPLPDFTPGYCAAHATHPLLDPLRFPREVIDVARTGGLTAVISDWVVWEFALNMVLFIPFGLIVRRVFELPRGIVLIAAFATSLLIELTQLTGNWGLAPCSYRFADITDLFTNTAGAAIGIAIERLTPRLLSTKTHLLTQREQARPVSRGRRLLGMLLDFWYLALAVVIGGTIASTIYALGQGGTGHDLTADQLLDLERWIFTGAAATALLVVLVPAIIGTGASLGQRTVYLTPAAHNRARWRLVARAIAVQGSSIIFVALGIPWLLLVPVIAFAAAVTTCVTPRGLSGLITGCRFVDARATSTTASADHEPA
ncbi:VanZ family protein [Nigerium massiliense]|uniref:VanZ family protein n=1 Tax=Nigerium massiliense TaxID=1522317 RepID=UPI000590D37C|nr:VanZ family protein [Nigerium massiliense]